MAHTFCNIELMKIFKSSIHLWSNIFMSKLSNGYTPTTFHCGHAISFFDFSSNY
jgi:hypothetical protein